MSELLNAALAYAARGWHVFPCAPDGKRPITERGYKDATTDPDRIKAWWSETPDANIGLNLERTGFVALDADTYKDGCAWSSFAANHNVPPTLTQRSARGGTHFIFQAEPDARYRTDIGEAVDTKHKGYVLLHPSRFDGGVYSWVNDAPIAPAPEWLKRPERTLAETVGNPTGNSGCTLAMAEEALRWINPDMHHDQWVSVLMALHDEFGDEGLTLAEEWSARAPHRYQEGVVEAKFASFSPGGGVSIGTVFDLARKAGANLGEIRSKHANTEQWFDPVPEADRGETIFDLAAQSEPQEPEAPPLKAGRITMADLDVLPPREWLYGTKLLRKYVSFIAAPGGVGKTAFMIAMMLACAANRALLHDQPRAGRPLNVWMFNLEDDIIEMRRRIKAAVMHFDLDPSVLDHIRLNSGRDRGLRIVKLGDKGDFIVQPDYAQLVSEMKAEAIDLLIIDPFLRSHGVPENDNAAQDEVMRLFAQIAQETDAAVVLVHHTKKGAIAGDLDSMRGGSTQGGGARSAYTLAPMSAEEAERVGVPEEERRLYVRVDDAKSNMAPPLGKTEWLRLVGVALGNGNEVYAAGDNVQVATAWSLPDAWEGVGELEAVLLAAIDAGTPDGERYSIRSQDKARWAGDILMERAGKSIEQAKVILAAWEKEGRIETREYTSPGQHKKRKGLYVTKRPAASIFD